MDFLMSGTIMKQKGQYTICGLKYSERMEDWIILIGLNLKYSADKLLSKKWFSVPAVGLLCYWYSCIFFL